ncbi:A24 family peptidase [Sphingomonas endophytica]|uniref:Prepilin leader peptidase/N-methyltransferase n=1 Tax=Sphingomonas endophytica TaxID=869719 RepID=A0ABR6N185_9SPHN|nr:A24 family peptidase [Sphingomonas endophytica]MBB5724547.1 leader peptidase (prepilin peptidase)/N-methyltransferase [Sphingomonas endophytica]
MWAVVLGVLGAVVGSFLATIALRWPQERSIVHGRSACDGCGRTLRATELVPLLSWLVARGRCRTCDARIDPLHPLVEAGCAAVGVSAALVAPGPVAMAGAGFGWLLLVLAVMDARDFWLPDPLVAALALVAAVGAWIAPPALGERLAAGVGGFAVLWLIGAGYRWWRGREGLGGGDPKLFGAIGLALGWRMLPAVLLVAGLVGVGWVLFHKLRGRAVAADDALPLGTLLAIAAYPAWLLMIGMAA